MCLTGFERPKLITLALTYFKKSLLVIDTSTSSPQDAEEPKSKIYFTCLFLVKILESLAISMVLFILFVSGESFTITLQLFRYDKPANVSGVVLSLPALIVHGTTVIVSMVALGCS